MKKIILLNLFFVFTFAETFIVDQNGSGDYSDIQIAINENSNGDTLLIYPEFTLVGLIFIIRI